MKKRTLLLLTVPGILTSAPTPAAVAAFDAYVKTVETRLAEQHRSPVGFLAPGPAAIERITPSLPADFPGALLHHWRGTAFAPGATAANFEVLLRDFNSYPRIFPPEVLDAKVLSEDGDRMRAWMRIRQKHIITVVMDTTYDITFFPLDAKHGYSISRSTRIAEISDTDHGFLWRLNTYWSYEERDGGLYLQIESVSLTRSIPAGLAWIIRPFVETIPRESLEVHAELGMQRTSEIRKDNKMNNRVFTPALRVNQALTASIEKRALQWMACRAPVWLTSDQLTMLGLTAQIGAGAAYALSRYDRHALLLVILCVALNWFGDSMDGTLARVRCQTRPRYGFYVDHTVDMFGSVALMCGLGFSGFLHWQTAIAMLVAFLLLSGESYLATYTLARFELSQGIFGPTEIRILLIAGNLALLRNPYSTILGHRILLFDLGGTIAAAGMFAMAVILTLRHTAELYREEPLP